MYEHAPLLLFYLLQMALSVVDIQGGRQCRSAAAAWCGGCREATPPLKPSCSLHGLRYPHPSNCSLFFECMVTGSASYACVCSCANGTMFFNSRLDACTPRPEGGAGGGGDDCTILETHLNLLDGGLSALPKNATFHHPLPTGTPDPGLKEGSGAVVVPPTRPGTQHQGADSTKRTPKPSSAAPAAAEVPHNRRRPTNSRDQLPARGRRRKKKPVVIHDNPAVPTWVVALLVFLGVLVLLVVVLSLYH